MPENPWLKRRVIAYAHQGGAKEAPSSTLFACGRAIEAGATGIELDVHATLDRRLVVCHDATVDRTTPGSGEIRRKRLSELKDLDNAYYFVEGSDVAPGLPEESYVFRGRAPADVRFSIATLEEVLEATRGTVLNLDIKKTAPAVEPYEDLIAEVLREHERCDDVIVASFHDSATAAFSRHAPEVSTSAGTAATAEFFYAVITGAPTPEAVHHHVALQVPMTYQGVTVLDARFVARAHDSGLAVHVWTIDDEEEMASLVDLGIDGIISDRPSALVRVLSDRALGWTP